MAQRLPSAPRPYRRRAWLWVVLALLAAAAGLVFAVRIYLTPERARAFAARALSAALGREVRFADADLSYWPPFGVRVKGLAVADPRGFQQGTMLTARSVRLHLSAWDLLARRLSLQGVEIEEPAVRLWRGRDGHANWEGLAGIGDTTRAHRPIREVAIPGLRMTHARLGYFGSDGKLAFYFQNLDLSAANHGDRWDWKLRVEQLGNPRPIPYLSAPIVASGDMATPHNGAPVPFHLQAECGDLTLTGSGAALASRFAFTKGKLTRRGSPASIEDLRLRYVSDAKGSRIELLDGRVGQSRFASAAVLEPPPLRGTFKGDLDLGELARFLPPEQRRLTGRVRLAVQFLAPSNDRRGVQLQGLADLSNVNLPAPSPEVLPMQGLTGRVWFSQLSANTTDLQGRWGALPFRFTGRIDEPLALAHALDPTPPPGARVANVKFDLTTGPVDADVLFPPGRSFEHPPLFVAQGALHTPRLKAQRLDAQDVIVNLRYDRGVVHLDGATATGYGGQLTAGGDFDFRAPQRPGYGIRVQGTGLDAETVLGAWTPPLRQLLTGKFDVNMTMKGAGFGSKEALAHLDLDALAKSVDGRLAGSELLQAASQWSGLADLRNIKFKDLLWHIIVKDGRVLFRDVTIHGVDGDYAVSGWIGLNGDLGLAVAMAIPSAKLSALTSALRAAATTLSDSQGRVLLDFAVGGTIHHPAFTLKTDRAAEMLVARLTAELLGKINPLERALGDSLSKSKSQMDLLQTVVEAQKQVLKSQTQHEDLQGKATEWLQDLLHPKSRADSAAAMPMPPASDTAKAPPDTVKAAPDTTHQP